nr:transposase [Candidatus Entotheonella palauensis]
MNRPDDINLSREEGEALIERLETHTVTAEDCQVLAQVVRLYFWLLFALQETKLSLNRFRVMIFGDKAKASKSTRAKGASSPNRQSEKGAEASSDDAQGVEEEGGAASEPSVETSPEDDSASEADPDAKLRPGHGRLSADAYAGVERVECRHQDLAPGDRCPVCGIGWLYSLPPGREIRINGHALLSAIRYEVEKLRCSACGERFSAPLPPEVMSGVGLTSGDDNYHPSARSALALSRYFLSVPFYRLEAYPAMMGVPVPDATQWDQVERVADSAYMVFEYLVNLAAQGELIYQDDTSVRILSLMRENKHLESASGASPRTGMHRTALVVESGGHTICLYFSGRAHAGENLKAMLSKRNAHLEAPLVMSDALDQNEAEGIDLIRCHCMAHGRRKFTEIESAFPEACEEVVEALKAVFDHEEKTRKDQMSDEERLAYHQAYSKPVMATLKSSMETQRDQREVEPSSSLGKAFTYWFRALANPDSVLTRARRTSGQQHRRAGFEADHPSTQKLPVLCDASSCLCRQLAHQPDGDVYPSRCQRHGLSRGVAGTPLGRLCQPGRLAAADLPSHAHLPLSHPSPVLRHGGLLRIAVPQHNGQFPGRQRTGRLRTAGPPVEAPLRPSLHT